MKKIYILLILGICLSACNKNEVLQPDFIVTTDSTVYKVNEQIKFTFIGSADIITFYSGQVGKEYAFRNRFRVDGKPQMQFTSYMQLGPQTNSLSLLASTNFNGIYNTENIALANWSDITSRATLSTGIDNTPSGVVNLSDFAKKDSVVYIAFKYVGKKDPLIAQPTWTIKNIAIDNKIADSSLVSVVKSANISWGAVNVGNLTKAWTYSATQIQMAGGPVNTDDNEDWIITQPLSLDRVQRSLGVNVKTNPIAKIYSYVFPGYSTPGTYTVTFEAINANRWGTKTLIREIIIKIE